MMYSYHLLVLSLASFVVQSSAEVGHGWHKDVDWKTLEDGKAEAAASGKPLMIIIHKSWCGACKALKPKFGESSEIAELAKNFVMVNTEDDEEPSGTEFSPDGGYIPRILFLNSAGDVQNDVYNKQGSDQYKYYYSDSGAVLKGMQDAAEHFA
eukprot:gene4460-21695_t